MKKLRIVLIAAVLVAAVGGVTYLNRSRGAGGALVSEVKRDRHPVTTHIVRRETLRQTVAHSGTLEPIRDVTLSAEVSGKVVRRSKSLGQACGKGAVLLQLDAENYRIALLQTEAALTQARAQLGQGRRELARSESLVRRNAVSHQAVEQARTVVQTGEAATSQAEAAVALARRNLRETTVRCPFDGMVADIMVEVGQTVAPQVALARLVQTSTLKLRISVPPRELGFLHQGQQVSLADPTSPTAALRGTVVRLGVAGDPATHTFPVEIEVPITPCSPPGEGCSVTRAGQVVQATIQIATHENAIAVPHEAVEPGASHLFLVRSGKAARAAVVLGARVGDKLLVASGLKPGDEVIVSQGLRDGDRVEPIKADEGVSDD